MSAAERRDPLSLSTAHVLRDYTLLADGERGIIVGPGGDFAWMCFPHWDSEACFATLAGARGTFVVAPTARYTWGGYYESGLIWRSRWSTNDGVVECRDALAMPGRPHRAVVLRQITVVEGDVPVVVAIDPRGGYGMAAARRWHRDDAGRWSAQIGSTTLTLTGAETATLHPDGHRGHALWMELRLEPGQRHNLVLVLDADPHGEPPPDPDAAWLSTEEAWRDAIPDLKPVRAERDAKHAWAVLTGMTSASGGMVAAATMSVPERAHQGSNYDYRYVWIRDQAIVGLAAAKHGPCSLTDSAVSFVRDRLLEHGPELSPAYTVLGGRVPDERELPLDGYPGGAAIVGNHVNAQFQLDGFGDALLLLATAADQDRLDADGWCAARAAIDAIRQRWQEPDAGIWELEPDAWTHSRLTCVAGLRAIAGQDSPTRAAPLLALADAILADTAAHSLHPSGRWQRSPSDPRVDAALLLPAIRGALPAGDPRTLATLEAVERDLADDGYCYRFKPDDRPLGEAEGAFLLCGFLMSLAWSQQGDHLRAARWFERNRSAPGPSGLVSEEFDVNQRQLRGNFPQAFVHGALLECAATASHIPGL
jgi:GH15 family glucan-1,4-alpha-glucosidase